MFTGLVDGTASVLQLISDDAARMTRLIVANDLSYEYKVGDSIAVNGCCLTVTRESCDRQLVFDVSRETLEKSNLGQLKTASQVNLEQAMRMNDRLDGHLVSGHVDAVAEVVSFEEHPTGWLLRLAIPENQSRYVIPKGSICLNGVSLTINNLHDQEQQTLVEFMLIPTTLEKTNLAKVVTGDWLNVEYDLVGKYIHRFQTR